MSLGIILAALGAKCELLKKHGLIKDYSVSIEINLSVDENGLYADVAITKKIIPILCVKNIDVEITLTKTDE